MSTSTLLRVGRVGLITIVLALAVASPAGAAWQEIVGGPSPINRADSAEELSLASVAGVPYVAWMEYDGTNREVRVARLNAAGTAWERVADGPSPINQSPNANAYYRPHIADVGGTPYVTWAEADGTNDEVRVARLNAAGTAWEKVGQTVNPASPLNFDPNRDALSPTLASVNGEPFVAWTERDAQGAEIRVARLNAAGTAWGRVADGPSPINQSPNGGAFGPNLTAIGGIPHVAWRENVSGGPAQIRVARLNAAGTAWEKVGQATNPASPINESPTQSADQPSLGAVDGVPYVAWSEEDGVNDEIRVARLNAAGTAWEKVGQATNPASPINQSAVEDGDRASLAVIGGVPYVAWAEDVRSNYEIHVARPNAGATDWENVAGPVAPIDRSADTYPFSPSLAVVGGVPHVAWREYDAAETAAQVRVGRLEPELLNQAVTTTDTTATLAATWNTYGLAYPFGFDYGSNLERATTPVPGASGQNIVTVSEQVGGLAPASSYSVRPFATAGTAEPRVLGDVSSFTTTADTTPPETTITKEPPNKLEKSKAKYKFVSSEPNSTFVCRFDKRKPKPCDEGKVKYKRLDDGKHKFRVYAVDAAGNRDQSPAKDKFKVV